MQGNREADVYAQVVPALLAEGRLALALTYTGEEQGVGLDPGGGEVREPALCVDFWEAVTRMFPHRVGARG